LRRTVHLLTTLVLALAAGVVQAADTLVLTGGKVYTLNPSQPWAEAVVVQGDRIVYVGDNQGAHAHAKSPDQRIDLAGRMVLPGFIDTHMHVADSLPYVDAVELTPAMSAEEVLATIAAYAEANPDKDPLVGSGFLALAFGELGPTADQLDAVVGDRPAIIIDEGGHSAWVNSRALAVAGITRDTPDPVPGAHYLKRYSDGSPTGWLVEGGAFGPVVDALGVITAQRLAAAAEHFFPVMSSMGITAAFDAGMIDTGELGMDLLDDRARSGDLPLRIVGSYYVNKPGQLPEAVATVQALNARYNSEFFRLDTLKVSLDGTVEAGTALTLEPYIKPAGHRATPLVPPAPTREAILQAAAEDMDLHLHALGDGAVRFALDTVAEVRETLPGSKSRITLCHLQVVNPADVERFGALDVIAQSTPTWYEYDEGALQALGRTRFEQMYPLAGMAAGGARLTLGSDFPATWIGRNGLSPLYNIEMALTRRPAGDPEFAMQPAAGERISLAQAIRAYTLDAAYQLRLESEIGSLQAGKKADLVVLDRNLFDQAAHQVHESQVDLTLSNGRIVYRRQ